MEKKALTKITIIKTLEQHKADLDKFGVKRIGLFGSFLKNKQRGGAVTWIFWLS